MLSTLRIRTTMSVPAEFCFDRMRRSERFVPTIVDTLVTLRAGCEHLELQTTVHNDADDHRFRVLLPSGADADTYLADTPFDVVRRPIALREDNHLYRELEVETKPQQSWTAVHDDRRGLAVVCEGLCESAVRDLPRRPIALTLFRATRRTVMTDGEPAGQLRGKMVFRYWIVPLHGKPDVSRLCRMGQQILAGLRDVQLRGRDVAQYAAGGNLPPIGGWFEVDGSAVVTSIRQVGEGLEVRMFNPTNEQTTAGLRQGKLSCVGCLPKKVECVDFESRPVEHGASLSDEVCQVPLGPKQIVTLRLT
jgi:alpha-mannosidase/mannosylglycerate hydrolase